MKRMIFGFILLLVTNTAYPATLSGELKDGVGQAVKDAVITVFPMQGELPAQITPQKPKTLDQVNREFVSHVLAIRTGEAVIFPNNDKTQHHVYSFSPANRFEIKLYSGVPSKPITFNSPGIIALGCNIHDWMVGYIVVTDTPYFATTDTSGKWSIELPMGDYKFTLWHENLDEPDATMSKIVKVVDGNNIINDTINLKHARRSGKPPGTLQEQGYVE